MIINLTRTHKKIVFDYAPSMDLSTHRHFYPSVQDIFQIIDQPFKMMDYAISDCSADVVTVGSGKNKITIPVNHVTLTRIEKEKKIKKSKEEK